MARTASLDTSLWLPTYGWWPDPQEYDVSVVLTPYHAAVEPEARFAFTLRGYQGTPEPVWEHEVGELALGDERGVRLNDLDLPPPPPGHGGLLEIHGIRLDQAPRRNVGFVGMWIDVQAPGGGGYIIPTIPIRGQAKAVARDDLQIVPGIVSTASDETEVVILNPIDEATEVRLVASSVSGLTAEAKPFTMAPFSAWRGSLNRVVPRIRRLLEDADGVGSLAIHSSHRVLPYFGFRRDGGPLLALDHTAPIFA